MQVLWEQKSGDSYARLCYREDLGYTLELSDSPEYAVDVELSPQAALDLAFTIYEELG